MTHRSRKTDMTRRGFCRAIWGDLQVPTFEKARRDVEYTIKHGCHPEDTITFCFGGDNKKWLRIKRKFDQVFWGSD